MSRVQRCRDGSTLDPEDVADLLVAKVGVVTKKKHKSLSLGKLGNLAPELRPVQPFLVRMVPEGGVRSSLARLPKLTHRYVHERSPNPIVKTSV